MIRLTPSLNNAFSGVITAGSPQMSRKSSSLKSSAPYLAILVVWIVGSLSTISLFLEYPRPLFNIHLRTYPGMFLWPVVFLPVVALFLIVPVQTIWRFIDSHFARPILAKVFFIIPVVLIVSGMSGYEWFNGKYAIWEVAPSLSGQQPAVVRQLAREWNVATAPEVGTLDDWALSIRSRADPRLYLSECRFAGKDLEDYRQRRCHCSALKRPTTGGECDQVREVWYTALGRVIAQPSMRSYTYYLYRISFTAMALVFIVALLCVGYMESFAADMQPTDPKGYQAAKTNMHVVALFCVLWWIQYLYFGSEQFLIFPFQDNNAFRTFVISIIIGLPIAIGTVYAFGQRIRVLRSFMENLFIPLLGLGSALFGAVAPEMAARAFRVLFGVEASTPALIAFITLSFGICLFPLLHFMRDGGFAVFRAAVGKENPPPRE
jgi:hypothetical protein